MGTYLVRITRRMRGERGEVASWLILAAGLALAAALAATVMGSVIGSLASRVAEAAEGQGGSGTTVQPEVPAVGEGGGGSGSGNPTPTEQQGGEGAGEGSGEGGEGGEGAGEGGDGGGGIEEPPELPASCHQNGGDMHCDDEGNCLSFNPLECSTSPQARDAYRWHQWYETCAVPQPSIIVCREFTPGFDAGFRAILESEIGAHPGDLFLAAARACDAGHASCQLWTQLAHFVFDNREVIATTTVLGDIIPGPRGVSCIPSFLDGAITVGEATECAIGIGTGLSVPFPSGAIDDALEGG